MGSRAQTLGWADWMALLVTVGGFCVYNLQKEEKRAPKNSDDDKAELLQPASENECENENENGCENDVAKPRAGIVRAESSFVDVI